MYGPEALKGVLMIFSVPVSIKEIVSRGRDFPWTRPSGYFERFQAPVEQIRSSIAYRLQYGRWPKGSTRARQSHWLRALYRKTTAYFGQGFKARLLEGFDYLVRINEIAVSRRI